MAQRGATAGLGRNATVVCLKRIAAAEMIGWPALAQSWKRTLAEIKARKGMKEPK